LLLIAVVSVPWLRVEYALWQGRRALQSHRADLAITYLESARKSDPDRAETEFLLARANRRLGRMDEVQRHLVRATRLGWSRDLVQREEWLAMAQSGQVVRAEPHLGELLRNQQDDGAEICEAFVEGYFASFRFNQGLVLIDAWERDYPDDPRPHVYRGMALEQARVWDQAAEAYGRALSREPGNTDCRLRLAGVLISLHKYDEAAAQLQICRRERPDDAEVACRLAECLRGQGQVDEARVLLAPLLERDAGHQHARLLMGQLAQMAGDFDAALNWLQPLCSEYPTDVEARYALAQVLQATGRREAAQEHLSFVTTARAELQEVQSLTDPERFRPEDPEQRYQIGIRLLKYDVPSHGAAWLRTVLDLDPNHGPAHVALAGYYDSIGSHDLAAQHRRQSAVAPGSQ
jgi:predicted Zn-dependent protease